MNDYLPHGHCFYWESSILWPYVGANAAISLAYVVGFPLAMRPWIHHLPPLVLILLAAFTLFCGLGHAWSAANVWMAAYHAEASWDVATACASWTFVIFTRLLARAYRLEKVPGAGER